MALKHAAPKHVPLKHMAFERVLPSHAAVIGACP
ncbi:hypothetical protein SMF913_13983 [Streptomyces malaysiensis]|uniref:Uncharacterized protein n=1 Tax=Streptomyces malaysiensis TaxID=92644 RepID=A0A2J7ZCH1_STRMQ|nr:hypothetical protein SMF913_13983 [Streptomyces malaysiensis]